MSTTTNEIENEMLLTLHLVLNVKTKVGNYFLTNLVNCSMVIPSK